jgi:hypothetical protein
MITGNQSSKTNAKATLFLRFRAVAAGFPRKRRALECGLYATRKAAHAVFICFFFGMVAACMQPSALAVQSVTLAWEQSVNPSVIGYNVYYGTASGVYTQKLSVGDVTSATITGLVAGTTYYFVITAYNAGGLESDPSNQVSYTVPESALQASGSGPEGGPEHGGPASGSGPEGAILAMKKIQLPRFSTVYSITASGTSLELGNVLLREASTAYSITATGPAPRRWSLEVSSDLKNWKTVTETINEPVNVPVVVDGAPALFFRLKGQ